MGKVYLAHDEQLDRTVALKVLPAEIAADHQRMRRFIQEAKVVSALNHPNILTIHEIGDTDTVRFIATEFIDGQTLRSRINSKPLPVAEALDIGIQIASALNAAHAANIVHRDIKPENVMLRRDGYVKLLDFGLAKLAERQDINLDQAATLINTEAGMVLGTAGYMSPEQARGVEVDARTDIWSLGVVLYEMLTGRAPFAGTSTTDLLVSILDKEPAPLPENTAGAVTRILGKTLEKDRAVRYQSAAELEQDLRKARQDLELGRSSQPTRMITQPNRRSRLRPWLPIFAFVVLVLLGAAYIWRQRSGRVGESATGRITLAILPFRPLNAEGEIGFLGVGIPDAIISRLANIQHMRLRPTNAILRYQNQDFNTQQVGQELATDYLVTGTLQKAGDSLRVTVQLLRSNDGSLVWGDHYDKPRSDLLNVQDSIAEKIATALRIKMSDAEQARVYRRYTENAAAYEAYLKGRSQLARSTKDGTAAAVEAFEAALSLDPNYTLARSGLAMACAEMHLYFVPAAEVQLWGERAKEEAKRALAQDANLAETHQALAAVYGRTEFDWQMTISECEKALDLNPSLDLPHYLRGRALYHLGLLDEAANDVREGTEMNPRAYTSSENYFEGLRTKGITALLSGRYAEAVGALEEAHQLGGGLVSDWWLGMAYYYQGQKERAESLLDELRNSSSASAAARARATLASFLAARGDRLRARELMRGIESDTYMDHHVAYSVAVVYAQLSQKDQSVDWMRRAADSGFPCYPWFERDVLLEPMRNDPGFQRFMTDLKNTYETARTRYAK